VKLSAVLTDLARKAGEDAEKLAFGPIVNPAG
jgi:hypothetical protein